MGHIPFYLFYLRYLLDFKAFLSKNILSFTQHSFRIGLEVVFASDNERAEMFKKMDDNGDGAISFDEWLAFSLEHIIAKVVISIYVTFNLSNYLLI